MTTTAKRSRSPSTSPKHSPKKTIKNEKDELSEPTKVKEPQEAEEEQQPKTNTEMPTHFQIPAKPVNSTKIMSWNVNSWPASMKKRSIDYIIAEDADIVCLQETKLSSVQKDWYGLKEIYPHSYWNCGTRKKGYAGTAVLSKLKPLNCWFGFQIDNDTKEEEEEEGSGGDCDLEDDEGRIITLEFEKFILVATYVPNAGMKLERLDWKVDKWTEELKKLMKKLLEKSKNIVWAGDINVARDETDLARPKENRNKTPGFTDKERQSFEQMISEFDLVDAWRLKNGEDKKRYTYFSYRFQCRKKNLGWRLDYFMITKQMENITDSCDIREEVWGASDHVPIVYTMNIID